MSTLETVCTQLFNTLHLYQRPELTRSENLSIEHQRISIRSDLESFTNRYDRHRKLILSYLDSFLKTTKNESLNFEIPNKILIKHLQDKTLVIALKEILSPVGLISELMNIVSLCKLFNIGLNRIKHNKRYSEQDRPVIDGTLTNWKIYRNREKRLALENTEYGSISIELVGKKGKEQTNYTKYKTVRYSPNSLQRTLALQLSRKRKPDKVNPQDIVILRLWWSRDANINTKEDWYDVNKRGWYEVLKKLKGVHPIESKKFKDERIKRQRFILRMMKSLKGSFKEKLEKVTFEVNKRFPRNKLYTLSTVKREYMRARFS